MNEWVEILLCDLVTEDSGEYVEEGRECKYCGESRVEMMRRDSGQSNGLRKCCRACYGRSNADWKRANPESARASQEKWRRSEAGRSWAQENQPRYIHSRRIAIEAATCPDFTADEWAEALEATDYRCIVCASPDEIEYGHLIPIKAHGGCNAIHNVAPLCRECNRGRGGQHSRLFWEWLPERLAYLEGLTCSPSRTRSPVRSV